MVGLGCGVSVRAVVGMAVLLAALHPQAENPKKQAVSSKANRYIRFTRSGRNGLEAPGIKAVNIQHEFPQLAALVGTARRPVFPEQPALPAQSAPVLCLAARRN